jgi:hypothetical protein
MRTPKPVAIFLLGLVMLEPTVAAAAPLSQAEICAVIGKAVTASGDGFAAIKGPPSKIIKGWSTKIRTSADLTCMIFRSDEPPSPDFWCRTPLSFGEAQLSLKACFPEWTIDENPQTGSWIFALSNPKSRTAILISADTKYPNQAVISVFLGKEPASGVKP